MPWNSPDTWAVHDVIDRAVATAGPGDEEAGKEVNIETNTGGTQTAAYCTLVISAMICSSSKRSVFG